LSNNSLSSFPKQLEEFPELILLDLRNNQLTSLEEGLCKLANLKALLLGGNPMKTLPSCVYDMTQLEVLTMFGCRINISKEGFAKLINLRILGLGGNNFSEEDLIFLKEHLPNCNIIVSVD
jgi:Leucine-rich repeat (LRR) protein